MRRFLKNFTANSIGTLITVCGQLFSIPLFLHLWNKQLYGEWLVMTAVPNLLWSLEGGLGVLAASRMTLSAAAKDWRGANEIFQTTVLSQILLSIVLYAGTIYVALTANVADAFGFKITTNHTASLILLVMMGYMLLGLMMSVYRAAFRASELEARGAMVTNCWRLTDLLIIIMVLSFHGGPVRLAECMFLGILVWMGIGYLEVRRHCKNVRFGFDSISWMRLREMVVHGVPLLLGQLTVALFMQGYPLVVNRTLGSAAVVSLTTLRTISRFGLLAVQTVAFSSSAQLSRSCGAQDWVFFRRLLTIMATVAVWSTVAVTLLLTLLGPWILTKWTGGRLTADHFTICLFAFSVSLQGIWTCCQITLTATNRHHYYNYGYFSVTALALIAAYFLTPVVGFNVIPGIMVVADIFLVFLGFYQVQKMVPQSHLRELFCVFTPAFYRRLIVAVITRGNPLRKAQA